MPDPFIATRRQLHAVAENLIAGPQYRAAGTIRLAVRPDGFTGTVLPLSVRGTTLVWPDGAVPLAGPADAIAEAAGLQIGPPPTEVYHPVAPLAPDTVLDLDPASADAIYRSLYAGGTAVAEVLAHGHPVLWPEHFDVGAAEGEVNYGVSAGDDEHPLPYAYVAPWGYAPNTRTGSMWNASFGALYPIDTAAAVESITDALADFFRQVQSRL
ncbi:MAG: hypothetical protein WAP49_04835 [Mycobacterium sp.]